ncbi:MAG: hypothetical protein KDC57_17565 [Saprospiraceae bacterium]|nr:hypothetical protein [Saprospiraceae bacterium]
MKSFFQILSFLFHPLFFAMYLLLFWLVINPFAFGVSHWYDADKLIIYIFVLTLFIPGLIIFMMYKLNMITSLQMPTNQERIGPLIVTFITYLWVFMNSRNNSDIPDVYTFFMASTVCTLGLLFFFNVLMRLSMHAAGMGSLATYFLLLNIYYIPFNFSQKWSIWNTLLVIIVMAGLVGTGRLYLNKHAWNELMAGYLVGIVGTLAANLLM